MKKINKVVSLLLALCMLISFVPVISAESKGTPVTISMSDKIFSTAGANISRLSPETYYWIGYQDIVEILPDETTIDRISWVSGHKIPGANVAQGKRIFAFKVKLQPGPYSVDFTPVMSGRGTTFNVMVDGQFAGSVATRDMALGTGTYVTGAKQSLNSLNLTGNDGWVTVRLEVTSTRAECADGYNDTIGMREITFTPLDESVSVAGIKENITGRKICDGEKLDFKIQTKMSDGSIHRFNTKDTTNNNMTVALTSGESIEVSDVTFDADTITGKLTAVKGEETSVITVTITINGVPHVETIEITTFPERVPTVTTVSMSDKIFSNAAPNLTTLSPEVFYWIGYQDIVEILPDETTIDRISWVTGHKIPAANVAQGKRIFAFKVRLVPGPYAIDFTPIMSGRGTTFDVMVDGQYAGSVATRDKALGTSTYVTGAKQSFNSLNLTGNDGWVTVRLEVTSTRAECADGYNDTMGMSAITFTPLDEPVSITGIDENITGAKIFQGKTFDFVVSAKMSDGSIRRFNSKDSGSFITASVADGSSVALSDMVMEADGLHGKIKGLSPEESTIKFDVTINGTTTNYEVSVNPIPVYAYSMLASEITTSGINFDSDGDITDAEGYTINWNDDKAVFVKEESNLTSFRKVSAGEESFAFPAGNYANTQFTFKAKIPADGYYMVSIDPLLSQLGGKYGVWVNGEYAGSVNSWNGIEGYENWEETITVGDEVSLDTLNLKRDENGYVRVKIKNLSEDSYKDPDCTPIAFSEFKLTQTENAPKYGGISHNITASDMDNGETRDFVIKTKMDNGSFKFFDPADTSKNNITATAVEGSSIRLSDVVLRDDGLYGKITALNGDDKAIITVTSTIDGVKYEEKVWLYIRPDPVPKAVTVSMTEKIFSSSGANLTSLPPNKFYWDGYQDVIEILPEETTINRISWVSGGFKLPAANIPEGKKVFAFKVKLAPGAYAVEVVPVMAGRGSAFNVMVDGKFAGKVSTKSETLGLDVYEAAPKQKLNSLNLTGKDGWVTVRIESASNRSECADAYNTTMGFSELRFIPQSEPISVVGIKDITETSIFKGKTIDFLISPIMNDGISRYFLPGDENNKIEASVADGSSVELSDMVMAEDGLRGKITGIRSNEETKINLSIMLDGVSTDKEVSVTPIDFPTFASTEIQLDSMLLTGDEIALDAVAKYSDGSIASAGDIENVFRSDSDKVEIEGNKLVAKSEGNARIFVTTTLKGTDQTIDGFIDVAIIAEGIKTVKLSAGGSRYIRLTDRENDTVPMYITAVTNLGNEVDVTDADLTYEALNPEFADITADGTIIPRAVGDAKFKVKLVYEGKTFALSDTLKVIWAKDSSSLVSAEMRKNAEENIKTYDWAKNTVRSATKSADKYVDLLDELYDMFFSEGLPRSFAIGYPGDPYAYTCQYCNTNIEKKYGSYSWIAQPLEREWKVKCPECARLFPSNDFGKFYKLGLNEYGEFDRVRALERHRAMFLGKIQELYPNVTEPGKDHSETWYQYYGYGIPGGYLTNDLYPEVGTANASAFKGRFTEGEKTERWSVDDGYGYFSGRIWDTNKGIAEHYGYIAVYIHSGLVRGSSSSAGSPAGNGTLYRVITELAKAYSYTGDPKYGRPAAILLDRLADLYPGYDFQQWHPRYNSSQGGTGQGKMIGSIWSALQDHEFARAYDYVYDMYDDPFVLEYIQEKGKTLKFRHAKETPSQIRTNIEDGILREIFAAVRTRRICGNFGFPQVSLATTAAVMNALPDTKEMIDYLMAPGFSEHPVKGQHVNEMDGLGYHTEILTTVDYDGHGEEASHYNYNHFTSIYSVQQILENITVYDGADLFENFPRFKKMAYAFFPLTMSDYSANMGDTGQTLKNDLWMSSGTAISLFRRLGDIRFAQYAYMANGNSVKDLREGIYVKNPEGIQKDIQAVIDRYGEFETPGEMLGGFGFATMKAGSVYRKGNSSSKLDNRRGVWMYWGTNCYHGHGDSLNFAIDAFGLDMTPDLGYPPNTEYTSENRHWVRATLSHNTVQVDDDYQDHSFVRGKAMHYDDSKQVKLIDVDAKNAYAQTKTYRRSMIMVNIDDDNSYYVDFFRIKGGKTHEYSFHAQSEAIAETAGLDLVDMTEYGSYANVWTMEKTGAQVEEEYLRQGVGADPYTDTTSGARYKTKYPASYTWLENLQRDSSQTEKFEVDFKITDFAKKISDGSGLHLRATMLGMDDGIESKIAIADGYPPQKAANNAIPKLKYLLVKREGTNLDTLFSTVYEPYRHKRTLENIEELPLTIKSGAEDALDVARAVKVTHAGGNRIDYVFYATNNGVIYTLSDNGIELDFRGFVGVYTIGKDKEGNFQNTYRYVNDGDILGEAIGTRASIEGQIAGFTTEHAFENEITMLMSDPISAEKAKDLAGKYIFVDNDGKLNASYKILGAEVVGDKLRLDIGDLSLIRGLVNELDLDGGYVYNISKWDNCRIPLDYEEDSSPSFENVSDGTTSVGSTYRQTIAASSPVPGVEVEIIGKDLPRGAMFDPATGEFSWKPTKTQIGDHRISFTARDEFGRETTAHFVVSVFGSTSAGAGSTASKNENAGSGSAGGGGGGGGGMDIPQQPTEPETPAEPEVPTTPETPAVEGFSDLGNHSWAADAIKELAEAGIIKGTSETTYAPAANITRADFAILLVRAFKLESEETENFADVSASDYFAKELAVARNTGIVGGIGDNKYAPRKTITRQDMMVIVYRVLEKLNIELKDGDADYPDFDKLPDYAKDAVRALIANGLVNGKSGLIAGSENTTRAEVAVLIKRILDFAAKK